MGPKWGFDAQKKKGPFRTVAKQGCVFTHRREQSGRQVGAKTAPTWGVLPIGVNATHGLRRTNDDKRRAVEAALRHPNAATMSNVLIAKHCGVHQSTVAIFRKPKDGEPTTERIVTRGNSTYTINTANIGRTAEPQITHYAPIPYDALQRLRTHGSAMGGVIVWVEGAC